MNLKIETYLYLDEDDWNPEEIARLGVIYSDLIVQSGYGNEADKDDPAKTRLRSVIIVKPTKGKLWEKSADGNVMLVSFPTEDEEFIRQADLGGIKDIG